ncbi:MAG: hypothetical protein V3U87_01350 [Methylococcaceae bacterium]
MIEKTTTNQLDNFLSESMQQALDDNFQNTLCTVKHVTDNIGDKEYDKFILVTISSIRFKCLVFLHFQDNNNLKDFIYDARGITDKLNDQLFYDYLSEMSNTFAGSLKRKLEYSFPVIGMSTPKLLDQNALDFFLKNNPSYIIRTEANLNSQFRLEGSFLLYLDNNYDFNLKAPATNSDDDSMESGELLLF